MRLEKDWRERYVEALVRPASAEARYEEVRKIGQRLGFEFVAYGIQMPVPITRPATALHNNYPTEWQRRYEDAGYIATDPTVEHALRSTVPLLWSDDVFKSTPQLWDEARAHGLNFGWVQSARDPSAAVGMLTLARSSTPISAAELDAREGRMMWLAQLAHGAMAAVLAPTLAPELSVVLTRQERDVLLWAAEGKTADETADIIGSTARTVRFYRATVIEKFGVRNIVQAAVRARLLGMI